MRDYIHVMDLARAHADALEFMRRDDRSATINLGTGHGISVLQLVQAFERASGKQVPYRIVDRRIGDVAEVFADPGLAWELFGWQAELGVDAMCADTWRWQWMNPDGYDDRDVVPDVEVPALSQRAAAMARRGAAVLSR